MTINTTVFTHKPPPMPTLLELLVHMQGCVVFTNTNGGNAYGNNQHKKERKEVFGRPKKRGRGADIDLGHRFKTEGIHENNRY